MIEINGTHWRKGLNSCLETAYAKFDEGVDLAIRLGVDPKKADQMVRGTVVLPNGTGKKVRVLVFAKGQKEKEALDAGADIVGGGRSHREEFQRDGWTLTRQSPHRTSWGLVSKLGKILGPRGLMPNPKVGTVTFDLERADQGD